MNYSKIMDTIVAIATPVGRGGIGILRISGKLVPKIAYKVLSKIPNPRKAEFLPFLDSNGLILEKVIALFFPEPHSFTGENVLEIHGHGGQMILNLLLDRILETFSEVRLANPGEFTERAFLNEKIDLIQAEAIADIIDATSYQAARSAVNSLQGMFSKEIHKILRKITNLRVYIESAIDFSDQDIDDISYNKIQNLLKEIIKNLEQILQSAFCGMLLKEGIKIVIVGKPNAGKSSLFNALMEIDRAIVSQIPGTTRDTLCEYIQLHGITCYITDTAGIRENSKNEIELLGITRTWKELHQADHILWVFDSNTIKEKNYNNVICSIKKMFHVINKNIPITIIQNKSDLSLENIKIHTIEDYTCINISVLLNKGIDLLKTHLCNFIKLKMYTNSSSSFIENNQGNFIARKRHLDILKKANLHLLSAQYKLNSSILIDDCFAEDLKLAHQELNKIFGKHTTEDLLSKIFDTFCIGK